MDGEADHSLTTVTDVQKKGLRNAGIAALVFVAIIVFSIFLPMMNMTKAYDQYL